MCYSLYAAASKPLPEFAWSEHRPAFHAKRLADADHPIHAKFSLPHVVDVGASSSCACNFRWTGIEPEYAIGADGRSPRESGVPDGDDGDDVENENVDFVNYLRPHIEAGVYIEIYGFWSGDESEPIRTTVENVTLEEIRNCYFMERVLLRLTSRDN